MGIDKRLRLHMHYDATDKPWGGGNSFVAALRHCLEKSFNCEMAGRLNDEYDILFLNSGYQAPGKFIDVRGIRKIKKKRKIVHRMDGLRRIYAGIESPMDEVQMECIKYADFVVFQSNSSLGSFRELGFNGQNFSVVYNGVDQDVFNFRGRDFWDGKRDLRVFSCSWSANPNKGHETIAAASLLKGVEVYFAGNWASGIDPKKVRLIPVQDSRSLSWYYRGCDILLYPSRNETCPNVVLEALSCGLPVIYDDSGGTPEIAGQYGTALKELDSSISEIKEKYSDIIARIKKDSFRFSIENSAKRYMDVFTRVNKDAKYGMAEGIKA